MRKKFKPTWSKTYPSRGAVQPKDVEFLPFNIVGCSTKGTQLENFDDKLMKTAPHRLRLETLRKHGKKALQQTFLK